MNSFSNTSAVNKVAVNLKIQRLMELKTLLTFPRNFLFTNYIISIKSISRILVSFHRQHQNIFCVRKILFFGKKNFLLISCFAFINFVQNSTNFLSFTTLLNLVSNSSHLTNETINSIESRFHLPFTVLI